MPSERRLYVGPSLRRLRRDLGLTQSDMAQDLEVSASYIALLERNHRPLSAEMLVRLAQTYRLDVALSELRYPRGVRVDNVATRYEYVLTAAYTLSPATRREPLKTGKVRVELTYDSADQPYASVIAQQDAQVRAAQEAARRIHLELAAFLAGQGS